MNRQKLEIVFDAFEVALVDGQRRVDVAVDRKTDDFLSGSASERVGAASRFDGWRRRRLSSKLVRL